MPERRPPRPLSRGRRQHPYEGDREATRTTHGAYTEREIDALADSLSAEMVRYAPWADSAAFEPGLRRWSRAEAVASKLWAYIAEHGPLDGHGRPRPALAALADWEASAAKRGAALGLDPSAMAKLLGTLAVSVGNENAADALDALRSEGRRLIAARVVEPEPEQLGPERPEAG